MSNSILPVHTMVLPNAFFEGENRAYVIGSDPLTLIDTGIASRRTFQALRQGFETLGLSLDAVGRVILTHKHIDHIGNAWRIQQITGATILIHAGEVPAVMDVDPSGERFAALVQQRLEGWRVPAEIRAKLSQSVRPGWRIESAEATPLSDGERIDLGDAELEVLHTPGHTMGSICLKLDSHLFTGDHVLPDISPNIGGGDMGHTGLLGHYFQSLDKIRQVDHGSLRVYPGHGAEFSDLNGRCRELVQHHQERLHQVQNIIQTRQPSSVFDVATELFGELNDFHVVLGCAEAAAHLEYLMEQGEVKCEAGLYRK